MGNISSYRNLNNLNQKTNSTDFLFPITHLIICKCLVVIFLVLLQENYLCVCFVACNSSAAESEGTQTEAGASAICFYFFLYSAVCFLTFSRILSGFDPMCTELSTFLSKPKYVVLIFDQNFYLKAKSFWLCFLMLVFIFPPKLKFSNGK